ncbi:MAG: DNA-directed RNA polymerase subunit alpha C-terminal domain-containing protein [Caldilineaceae bacterium]
MSEDQRWWYEIDPGVRAEVAAQYKGIPVTAINLSARVRNIFKRYNGHSRNDVDIPWVMMCDRRIKRFRRLGEVGLAEINERMLGLLDGTLSIAPEKPSTDVIVPPPEPPKVYLAPQVVSAPIGDLHLPLRATNALIESRIQTVGQLEELSSERIANVRGLGAKSLPVIQERISTLRANLLPDGTLDWQTYWIQHGIQIIPDPEIPSVYTASDLINCLPSYIERMFALEDEGLEWRIVEQRFGLSCQQDLDKSLAEIGESLHVDERTTQRLYSKARATLEAVLFSGDYTAKGYRLHSVPFKLLGAIFKSLRSYAANGILEEDLQEMVIDEFELSESGLAKVSNLLHSLAGLSTIRMAAPLLQPVFCLGTPGYSYDLAAAIDALHTFVSWRASTFTDTILLKELNRAMQPRKPLTIDDLQTVIRLCSSIEVTHDGTYRCRLDALHSRVEQVERIMREYGEPISPAAITSQMNELLELYGKEAVNERQIRSTLQKDARFSLLTSDGKWIVTGRNYESAALFEIIMTFLAMRGKPATAEEINEYVLQQRTSASTSTVSILSTYPEFVQLKTGKWGLDRYLCADVIYARALGKSSLESTARKYVRNRAFPQ